VVSPKCDLNQYSRSREEYKLTNLTLGVLKIPNGMFHTVKGDPDGIGKGNEIKDAMFSLAA
jgi:hypothetical protein